MSALARVDHVLVGVLLWSAPSFLVGPVAEDLWPFVAVPMASYGLWRGLTVRVTETAGGLAIRNVVRSFDLAWRDLTKVGWLDYGEGLDVPVGFVAPYVRVRGRRRRLPVRAMTTWMRPSRENAALVRGWAQKVTASTP